MQQSSGAAPADAAASPEEQRLLRHPGLMAFLGSRSLSALAYQMQTVAVGWQIYELTRSPLALGLVGLAQFLPMVLLVFVSGQVVDRFDRRRIAACCQIVSALCAATFAFASFAGAVTPAMIYTLIAIFGAARAFEGPSLQALLPALVPASLFSRAAALSSSAFQTVTIIGPSAGGLLYGLGAGVVYSIVAAIAATAALASFLIRHRQPERVREKVTLAAVFGGLHFIRSRPEIMGAISLDLFAVLLGGATAMMPLYAHDILHAGPWGLGVLRGAPAVGALLVSVWLARRPIRRHAGLLMFASVAVFGLATVVFGLSTWLPLSALALAVLGGADVVSVVVRSTLVQLRTPDEMRGRVAAVNMLFIGTSNQLGEFRSGTLAAVTGPVAAVVLGGIGTIIVAGLWMRLFPKLRDLQRLDEEVA
ncbi:MFS transporter [Roseomonas marmotae]|uniref:MFS transporter n=1 Tax=Roseomonas marmotae TaxID=2768161 RepID=A0ABS3KAG0_9PROT|nr:MFS transporter [Roseomonas marmotae]MBO1074434.1 MFS transporter [Roseomonas marmotae]QTI78171.1 MFS transporter [Roseomonas marmotae]